MILSKTVGAPTLAAMRLTQAILPVAGLGTRFLPWTKVVPKEMLPIGNRPIIALIVDEALSVGITDICFVISRGKEMVSQYFAHNPALETELRARGKAEALQTLRKYDAVRFTTVYQETQRGDGDAILQARGWVREEAVVVLFGDDLIAGEESGLQQMAQAYGTLPQNPEQPALLCLENIARERVSAYGIADVDSSSASADNRLHRVRRLVEKPSPEAAPSTLGVVGKYIIPRTTLATLATLQAANGKELRLIDALIAGLPGTPVYGIEVKGQRLDTGTPQGYREAVRVLE